METPTGPGEAPGLDRPSPKRRGFWRTEDAWAMVLGLGLLGIGVLLFVVGAERTSLHAEFQALARVPRDAAPFVTLAEHEADDARALLQRKAHAWGRAISPWLRAPQSFQSNPLNAFHRAAPAATDPALLRHEELRDVERTRREAAQLTEERARSAGFADPERNTAARRAIEEYRAAHERTVLSKKKIPKGPYHLGKTLPVLCLALLLWFGIGVRFLGGSLRRFAPGFVGLFGLAMLAYLCAAQTNVKSLGIGYAAWAIVLGLVVSNTVGTPSWLRAATWTEFYVKTGLVLLGAEVLLTKVLAIGLPGIFVAWVVTPVVLVATYWFGQRVLRLASRTLNITISADMSVCGVSAAIATAAACNAKKEELTLAVGLSMAFTSVMMVVLPLSIQALGLDPILGGAWIGGTIDATGAVAAAGAWLGDRALYVAATIKMIQNLLIGVIALGVAVYFSRTGQVARSTVGWGEVWRRFPKFVLGFVAASVVFSALASTLGEDLSTALVDHGVIAGFTKPLRGWCFCLAFVSIGLETNVRALRGQLHGGKPLLLYAAGQSLNLLLTLGMAYLMFHVVFSDVTARL